MRAMLLDSPRRPLRLAEVPLPSPGPHQILIRVGACGVCRTDLHIVDGELPHPSLPLILGHQIVGIVEKSGSAVSAFKVGDRVGVPWLQGCCETCSFCLKGRENLCAQGCFTGYQRNGGFAEYCTADPRFCFSIPNTYSDVHAAPLLCAGLIGYRALRFAGDAKTIGFYGFGSSAHILTQIACYQKRDVYAFTRPGDIDGQQFASEIGAVWAGDSNALPPVSLDAAIIFAPNGQLVPQALQALAKGGNVVCAGIHMSDIPSFPYTLLWGERSIRSVANLTRQDGVDFFKIASETHINTSVHVYPLDEANQALEALRSGKFSGSIVLFNKHQISKIGNNAERLVNAANDIPDSEKIDSGKKSTQNA